MSITTEDFLRRFFAFILALAVSAAPLRVAEAADSQLPTVSGPDEDVTISTTSSHHYYPKHQSSKPMRHLKAGARKFQKAIKSTSPNPRVQGSRAAALPAQAPPMRTPQPPAAPPETGAERFFAGAAKVMTKSWGNNIFVWLPAISTDPNSGPTYGIMPVLVMADPLTHHIRHLFAPSYTYNSLFGQTGTMRYYFYPTDSSQLYANGSYSERTNRELKLRYANTDALEGILYVQGETYYSADASPRFHGIGPDTNDDSETGYVAKDGTARGDVGINFANSWRATVGARFRRLATDDNVIPNTPDIKQIFPDVPGVGTLNTTSVETRLLWDTRDSPVTPVRGASGETYFEAATPALGGDADFIRYGLEGKRFFTYGNPRQVTVLRGLYDWENGPLMPFYEMPSVGGRETLRGYGDGRFVDRGRLLLNVEHRFTIASLPLMGIETDFQLAPFVDFGSVFHTVSEMQWKDYHPVVGGAFRAAVKPNVVGDVEVGVGNEGPAVFVDINYPY